MPRRCRATHRLDRWGVFSPTRSRRACLKTWRIGNSVKSPMARTTQQTTSWVRGHRRGLIRPVAARAWRTASGGIICSSPANRSKIRPDASGGSVHCPGCIVSQPPWCLVVGNPKVTGGCDLPLFQRYWEKVRTLPPARTHGPSVFSACQGHSVGGITYRHYAHRAPLAFRAIMTLPRPSVFSAILRGGDSQCPCCRRRFADAG